MDLLFIILQRLLPQHLLSRVVGFLAEMRQPVWLKNWLIKRFAAHFKVNMSEAAEPDVTAYACFNDFFTRALKDGARPIAEADVVCPADGAISQLGAIDNDHIFQAKGRGYSTTALLGGDRERAALFRDGSFATIYLSPRDYHRLHMPVDGRLVATRYVPGDLYSVNGTTAEHIDGLFARNERLVCHFDTPYGPMAMVLVGAMIVAGIESVWQGTYETHVRTIRHRDFVDGPSVELKQGEEMGRFKLGSTVILLFPKGAVDWAPRCREGTPTRLGEVLASGSNY